MVRKVTDEEANHLYEVVRHVSEDIGPGQPGSEGEAKRAGYFKDAFSELKPDDLREEIYEFHPNAFLDWIPISVTLVLVSLVLCWLRILSLLGSFQLAGDIVAFAMTLVGFIICYEEFLSYKEFIDPLFAKATGQNIVATFEPTGEPKATIYVTAHHDSAREFWFIYKFKRGYVVIVLASFLSLFLMVFLTAFNLVVDLVSTWVPIPADCWCNALSGGITILVTCLSPITALMYKFTGGNVVPGARDCLAGCATVLGTARYFAKPENRPAHVKVVCATLGSEEAGLRGSRRFVAAHRDEIQANPRVYNLNFDGIGTSKECRVVSTEITTRTRHDPGWVAFVADVARNLEIEGMETSIAPDPWGGGGTDAVSFTRGGVKATTIHMFTPLKQHLTDYHTRRDRIHFVEKDAIKNAVEIAIAVVDELDAREGAIENPGD